MNLEQQLQEKLDTLTKQLAELLELLRAQGEPSDNPNVQPLSQELNRMHQERTGRLMWSNNDPHKVFWQDEANGPYRITDNPHNVVAENGENCTMGIDPIQPSEKCPFCDEGCQFCTLEPPLQKTYRRECNRLVLELGQLEEKLKVANSGKAILKTVILKALQIIKDREYRIEDSPIKIELQLALDSID